jgi:Holliday junction resolvasome RuvABC endonuclease subunit
VSTKKTRTYFANLLRAESIAQQVGDIAQSYFVTCCMIENFAFGNVHTLSMLTEITTLIKHALYVLTIPFITIPPTSLKKLLTGKGNASKGNMATYVQIRYGFTSSNHNIIDAVALAMVFVEAFHENSALHVNNISKSLVVSLIEKRYSLCLF